MRLVLTSVLATFLLSGINQAYAAEDPASAPKEEGQAMDAVELDTTPPQEQLKTAQPIDPAASLAQATPNIGAAAPLMLQTTKLGMPTDQVGGSVSVITAQQIRNMQATSTLEVLRQVPGLDIVQNGAFGSSASVFLRGTNSEHTLVLMDGVKVNDPSSTGRSFNFWDQINPDSIERIEVLRGPQSTLYGADSIGGVINIITRSGEGRKPYLTARVMGGSYGTIEESISAGGEVFNKLSGNFNYARRDIRGFSTASNRYIGNSERDGFHNDNFYGRLQYKPFENLTLDVNSSYVRSRMDLDNTGDANGDDINAFEKDRFFTINGGYHLKLFKNRYEQIARFNFMDNERRTYDNPDVFRPSDSNRTRYSGKYFGFDFINHIHIQEWNTLTLGLNTQQEKMHSATRYVFGGFPSDSSFDTRSQTDTAFYAQDHIKLWDRFFTTLGYRFDHHDRFGNFSTYKIASSYLLKETGTTFKASYGTGFKAPSLYQLYSQYGDPDLNAEKSKGWDLGVEQALFGNRLQMGATYFQNRISNMIDFVSNANPPNFGGYLNYGRVRTQGFETFATAEPLRNLMVRASYTYTDTKRIGEEYPNEGDPLIRRPRNKFSLNFNYHPIAKLNINLDISHFGYRNDNGFVGFSTVPVRLKPYTLVNLATTYDLTKNVQIFGKLFNFLDTPYETAKGYASPRISAYGGLRFSL